LWEDTQRLQKTLPLWEDTQRLQKTLSLRATAGSEAISILRRDCHVASLRLLAMTDKKITATDETPA